MDEYKIGNTDLGDDKIDPVYKKGFEHGYWLTRGGAEKEVVKLIDGSKNHQGYSSGLVGGRKEAQREKIRDGVNKIQKSKSKDKGVDMS